MTDSKPTDNYSTTTVIILLCCLLCLIVLLFFLYKMLNKEANGKYTVQRMVYKEGGVRDRVRGAALALGTRLGVQLWPPSDNDEEMREVQDEERQVEEGGSQWNDSKGDDQEEKEGEEEEQCGRAKGEGSETHDYSSLESSDAEEEDRLTDQVESVGETEEKVGDGEGEGEASGGTGLLIDLKQFSGSAIWSAEEGGEGIVSDVTVL
ncbi:uncharacterized protein si:ch211-119e14.1 [Anoplopoma fimbria]|uniref:uncharacterized protein si:ch211-119e14.1 n=1 Tax=Anoplopoma fimbria TaxID=229290 RepID=UPI0023ED3433|nr:uncharacterized protein si:ch211-119e14.1 [Anoplopoma fimbria]XP_054457594.1 uncharacterized protein si:ch211-119e14.1 [Anoplopoma fimbria]